MRALAATGLALSLLTSCAEPSIVDCGDGRICPAGSVCTPRGCSLPGQCGDGVIDDGELCDDGNRTGGDGCSPACTVEQCTNGVLDVGEECDDGNASSHDGCSSGCLVERPTWHELFKVSPPGALAGMAAAWIPDRGRAILHGGSDGTNVHGEVWWWDGVTWTPAPTGPPPLVNHAMAWDGAGTVVMFGGTSAAGGTATDTCWLWGTTWTPCGGPLAPARFTPALATGATPGEVVLYGGEGAGDLTSTWHRTGGGWSDVHRVGPVSAAAPGMAYDPRAHEHVMVRVGSYPPQTARLGPAGWTTHDDGALQRENMPLVYDGDRGTIVYFGGSDELVGLHNEVLEHGPIEWYELSVGVRPSPRYGHVSFHDPIRHGIIVFGGYQFPAARADTWILRWESATVDENCAVTEDADGDGLEGCADPDCWGRCDPRCAPTVSDCDPGRPRCGDGICNLDLETPALCPADCP